ncbi:MAG: branched-chain-amino-acid transaminase [Nitrospirae bacterium]|nr:branched-chain-amino-acid transaminase [Nitrospirota bacterium]
MKIYIDGGYYEKVDAAVSVFDHGLLYGDGVFEGIRIYNGKVFKLRAHIERLYQSAKAIYLEIPMSRDELEDAVLKTVEINQKDNGYIRLIVTRGEGPLGIDPVQCKGPTVIIIVADIQLYPEEYYKKGIEIITASTRRIPSDCLDPRVKSLNYLNNILAKIEARQAGCQEAVMLNTQGFVAECTGDNIFIVKDGELLTPSPCHGALDGITMRTVLELAESLGIRIRETTLTCYDLYNADECFLTGTGAEIVPVVKIDGRVIGNGYPGKVTRLLTEEFRSLL